MNGLRPSGPTSVTQPVVATALAHVVDSAPPGGDVGQLADALRVQAQMITGLTDAVADLGERVRALQRGSIQLSDSAVPEYEELRHDIRLLVRAWLPPDAVLLVVSKGDEVLIDMGERRAWHFPRDYDGGYPGHHPASSQAAVIHLEALRASGATHLLIPEPSLWWLSHYTGFAAHLDAHYTRVLDDPPVCVVYALDREPVVDSAHDVQRLVDRFAMETGTDPAVLDWTLDETTLHFTGATVFKAITSGAREPLPYHDASIDVVVASSRASVAEARRVATTAVFLYDRDDSVFEHVWSRPMSSPLPSVSIIIPTYNGAAHMRTCLRALQETLPTDVDIEIIVVDDGSSDDTDRVVDRAALVDPRVTLLRSKRNGGFIDACTRGAAAATKDILLFLNNDTIPLDGWLEPVLRTFLDHDDVGAVGGKLVFPDGGLQEAGGVIYRDASGANFGKWDPLPDAPVYSYLREVDYCSGAHLATPRALFAELGGFDRRYTPAYYEDVDYCLSVWDSGRRVLYQPDSVVIHLEGATSGTDETKGVKRHQAINRETLLDKWRHVLESKAEPPGHYDAKTWHEVAVRVAPTLEGDGTR